MSCCEITWGQDNESTSYVTCCSILLYELVMITRLEQECEFMCKSRENQGWVKLKKKTKLKKSGGKTNTLKENEA